MQTLCPRLAIARAEARPTTPAPMTATSICSMVCVQQRLDYDGEMSSPLRDHSVPAKGPESITRVLITGAQGQLGAAMVNAFEGVEVTAHTRQTLDVTAAAAVTEAVRAA